MTLTAVAVLACATLTRCTDFEGLTVDLPGDGGVGGIACDHAVLPPPPSAVSPGTGDLTLTFASRDADIGEENHQYLTIGFDLDGVCSGMGGAGASCIEPPWAKATDHTDGLGGRDNAFGALLSNTHVDLSKESDQNAAAGVRTILIRISGYNGTVNDSQVDVAFFGADFAPTAGRSRPEWDGSDAWNLVSSWVAQEADGGGPMAPRYHDAHAYVTQGVLVCQLTELRISGAPDFSFPILRVLATIPLSESDAGEWSIGHAVIGGRLQIKDLLSAAAVNSNVYGLPVCDSETYEVYKETVCSYADIASSGTDNGASTCDALSIAWRFDAYPAIVAGVTPDFPSMPCDAGIPQSDTCDTLAP